MTTYDWRPFLEQLSQAVLASSLVEHMQLPPDVIQAGWLGFPGATEEQIAAAEKRLGTPFPPSYRAFLRVSNGWRVLDSSIERMWGVDQIEWFRTRHTDWINIWTQAANSHGELPPIPDEKYLVYGPEQDPVTMRNEYLSTSLEISDVGDSAILLLNPAITTPDGEWEAWFYATWLPGADRYRSFWDLMHGHYDRLREEEAQFAAEEAKRLHVGDTPDTIRAKVTQLIADVAARGLNDTADRLRKLQTEVADAAQLPTSLTALAQEFEDKHQAIVSQMSAPPTMNLNPALQNDPDWQAWLAQAEQGAVPTIPPPELMKKLQEMTRQALQQIMPSLVENQPQWEEAKQYQQSAFMIRNFLKG